MSLPFFIARRYLFSKKKHNAINIISGISVCGVALATLALVCTLSVFNGFQDMVAGFFTAFDDATSLHIVAHDGNQANRFAQSGQIFADIAANAAQRGMQRTGVGIPHDELTIALAVDIHIRAADTGNITHGYGLQMLA